jgi:predicted aminopeptidase
LSCLKTSLNPYISIYTIVLTRKKAGARLREPAASRKPRRVRKTLQEANSNSKLASKEVYLSLSLRGCVVEGRKMVSLTTFVGPFLCRKRKIMLNLLREAMAVMHIFPNEEVFLCVERH